MPVQSEHRRLLTVLDLKSLRSSLAVLASRLPEYFTHLRAAGFECSHVNEDWIEDRCSADDVEVHKRYLMEFACEVLTTGNASPDFGDEQNCQSAWLNELKAARLAQHGPYENLTKGPHAHHLEQLSPGWREFMRVRESSALADQAQVADQLATFVHRQAEEIEAHGEAIAGSRSRLPALRDALSLQAFFASELVKAFRSLGAHAELTMRRNQALQRDERVVAVVFDLNDDYLFVLLPSVVLSGRAKSKAFEGTLGIGFRLMTLPALGAPRFEFDRDTVVPLHELLPNKFSGYGRFDKLEEFCLNIIAWAAALQMLLPDVLQTLRATAAAAPASLH